MKITIKSRPISRHTFKIKNNRIIIVGNGPSARSFLDKVQNNEPMFDLLAVNKFAIDSSFSIVKPNFYLMHDGDFFTFTEEIWSNAKSHPRVNLKPEFEVWQEQINQTWTNLLTQNWGITLFIPKQYEDTFIVKKAKSSGIRIQTYNYTVTKGFQFFKNFIYNSGLGMPQCQNVINAAIFQSIRMPVNSIYVCGLDHDFHRNLSVGDDNNVYESVSHLYTKDPFKHPLMHADGSGKVYLRQIFNNLSKLHSSYFELHKFAKFRKVTIFNITPNGFVDEFPRLGDDVLFNN